MRRGSRCWAARALLASALVLASALGGLWLPVPAASAADPESWVEVSIDSMSPALPSRDGTIRLTGNVKNTSTITLSRLQAVLWRSLDPIQDTEGMDGALASAANEPLGSRVKPGTIFENIPSVADRTLAPGESAGFDLTADVEDFELPALDAVYLIGVQIRGRVEPGGDDEIVGRGRIFMPLIDTADQTQQNDEADQNDEAPAEVAQVEVTSIVLLASRPSLVRTGVLSDDHLAKELGTGGRLRTLLDAARQPPASFAVDPALVEELETMRRGYQVIDDNGGTTTGTGQAAATRWLEDFARLLATGDGFRVLFGSPDLTALVHNSQQAIIDQSRLAGDEVTSTRALPLLVLPGGGRADAATVAVADTLRPSAILLSENSARGPSALLAGPGNSPIVSFSATALGGGPGPDPTRTAVKIRQRALADTWLAASAAGEDGAAEVRLITTATQAASLSPDRIPWIKPVALSTLLAGTPDEWEQEFAYSNKAADAELSASQLEEVRELTEGFATYTELLVDASRGAQQARSTLPRTASSQWRNVRRAFTTYTGAVQQDLDRVLDDEISISVPARVLTTGRDARFPITVYNNLPALETDPQYNSIRVVVRFQSVNSQRLTVEPVELPPLPAQTNRTENVQVRAETNGAVQVTAELFTRSGRPLGKPVPILVNATQAGTTGWIIAIVAGIVLVGTTALRIRQVAKERSAEGSAEGGAEPVVVSRPATDLSVDSAADPAQDPAKDRDPLDV